MKKNLTHDGLLRENSWWVRFQSERGEIRKQNEREQEDRMKKNLIQDEQLAQRMNTESTGKQNHRK